MKKKCCCCKVEKEEGFDNFYLNKKSNRFFDMCKECCRAAQKKYKSIPANKKAVNIRRKVARSTEIGKKKANEYHKRWREKKKLSSCNISKEENS